MWRTLNEKQRVGHHIPLIQKLPRKNSISPAPIVPGNFSLDGTSTIERPGTWSHTRAPGSGKSTGNRREGKMIRGLWGLGKQFETTRGQWSSGCHAFPLPRQDGAFSIWRANVVQGIVVQILWLLVPEKGSDETPDIACPREFHRGQVAVARTDRGVHQRPVWAPVAGSGFLLPHRCAREKDDNKNDAAATAPTPSPSSVSAV